MRTYFDSSVLVAAVVVEEAHHGRALKALAESSEGFTSTHAVAEVFSTLTSGRLDIQLSPNDALLVIETNVCQRLEIIELALADYLEAIRGSQRVGARGGAIFDMLHLQAARHCKAARILTLNLRHFLAFAPDLKEAIALPG